MDPSLIPLISSILPLLKKFMPGSGGPQAAGQQAAQTGNQQALANQAAAQQAFAQQHGTNPADMPMTPQQAQIASAAGYPASETVGGASPNAVGADQQSGGGNLNDYATALTALNKYIDQKPEMPPRSPAFSAGGRSGGPFQLAGIPGQANPAMMPAGIGGGYLASPAGQAIISRMRELLQEANTR